jgi:hypothetical protein
VFFSSLSKWRDKVLTTSFSSLFSKPATEHDVSQKKRRKTSGNVKDVDLPSNVEIPGISTSEFDNSVDGNSPPCPILHLNSGSETDDATDDDALSAEVDIACNITGGEGGECDSDGSLRLRTSSSFVAESMDVMKNVARTPPEGTTVFENVTPSPNETPETSAAWPGNSAGVAPVNLNLAIPDLHDVRRSLPFQDEASATDGPSGNPAPLPRSIPTLSSGFTHAAAIPVPPELKTFDFEECKQELEDLNERGANNEDFEFSSELFDDDDDADGPAALRLPIPLVRRESFTTVASEYTYDDDSTVDHACSICLGGYRKGDMLSASKYCPHIFHKDCILQWLERRDECPCCRVKMITENEMNIAATSLVGKTRMVRAVAAYQSASPPGLSVPGVSGHASPFSGTVRRSAQQRD